MSKSSHLQAQLDTLTAEEDADVKATRKALKDAEKIEKAKTSPFFSKLTVSWLEDFEKVEISSSAEMTEEQMLQTVKAIPSAVAAKMKQSKSKRPTTGASPRAIQAAFRRRHETRAGKMAVLREQIRRLIVPAV